MASKRITGAPQLSRLFREADPEQISGFLAAEPVSAILGDVSSECLKLDSLQRRIAALQGDDLKAVERQAVRIVQVAGQRASNLLLRFAEGRGFDCLDRVSELAGPLRRAAWAYHAMPTLFVATERAMQIRSFRENRRIFHSYELQSPRSLEIDDLDEERFAAEIAALLSLRHGCRADAVELPESETSPRQIMIAVIAAGPRESQRTFEPDRSLGTVDFRPANELILVYLPDYGRIELCGRQWIDRKIVAQCFAKDVLKEDLSKFPLMQRNYDLSLFRGNLEIDVPEDLQDRIRSVEVVELRVALGSYDRKVTLTVSPGEDLSALRRVVFGAIRNRHGRGFVCDVELYLRIISRDTEDKTLRFRINNHNSSTLQSETDPDLRAVGFDLLETLGVVRTTRQMGTDEKKRVLPILLQLLDHSEDVIAGPELRELGADIPELTSAGYLSSKQAVETILVDEEDIGEIHASVYPEKSCDVARLAVPGGDADREVHLDEVSYWTINRDHIVETVLECFSSIGIKGRPSVLTDRVQYLGDVELESREVPMFLATRLHEDTALQKSDDAVRGASDVSFGIVLVPGAKPLNHLGSHVVVSLQTLLDRGTAELADLQNYWRLGGAKARSGQSVSFNRFGLTRAELILPEKPVWTIVGEKQCLIVERLYQAHVDGEKMVKSGELTSYADAAQLGSAFGKKWKSEIKGVYIFSPSPTFWALAV